MELASWTYWQREWASHLGEQKSQCSVPGSQSSSNAEPATEYGSACSEFSKGQKQEGQEQGKGHSDQSYIGPQRDNKCQSSEDGPACQEVAKRCPECSFLHKCSNNACRRPNDEAKGKPECSIRAKGNGGEGISHP